MERKGRKRETRVCVLEKKMPRPFLGYFSFETVSFLKGKERIVNIGPEKSNFEHRLQRRHYYTLLLRFLPGNERGAIVMVSNLA